MTSTQQMYFNSELALAAYASLRPGAAADQLAALTANNNMSVMQAQEFARRYPTVIAQFDDTATSFSATVFADTSGNLALAIRGTLEAGDYIPTDVNIAINGAGYDQIAALYNWWQRLTHRQGESITVYRVDLTDQAHPLIGETVLNDLGTPTTPVISPQAAVDVTGHSLGGHLALAFAGLFPINARQVYAFNAPGFIDSAENRTFFQALGGAVPAGTAPSGVPTFNVIADSASASDVSWSGIAGRNSRPGVAVDIPIEDQTALAEPERFGALNHSQAALADSLAVYALLAQLDPALSTASYKMLLSGAAAGTPASLEGTVYALQRQLNIDDAPLPVGNQAVNRNALYQAIYGLRGNAGYTSLAGKVALVPMASTTVSSVGDSAKRNLNDFIALKALSPFVLQAATPADQSAFDTVWQSAHAQDYTDWTFDLGDRQPNVTTEHLNYTDEWYTDRARMLGSLLARNEADTTEAPRRTGEPRTVYLEDKASGIAFAEGDALIPNNADQTRYITFGSDAAETLTGGDLADHLYGGGGDDTVGGGKGDDHLEGGAGDDIIGGGEGKDLLNGGTGNDELRGGDGEDDLFGGPGNDRLFGDKESDLLSGGDGIDELDGGDGDDALYGGNDADLLRGNAGNDTLSGGAGNDAYYVTSGEGNDTIIDGDPLGSIVWDGDTLTGGLKLGDNVWRSADGKFTYAIGSSNSLIITKTGAGGRVIVRDFGTPDAANPMFGIALPDTAFAVPMPETGLTLTGDRAPPYTESGVPIYDYDALGNLITSGQSAPYYYDQIFDSTGNDRIESGGGEDNILAYRGGDDLIFTGGDIELSSPDIPSLGRYAEADEVEAGGGNDYVDTGYGPDWVDAGAGSDWIVAGDGEDAIFTSHNFVGYPWHGPYAWDIRQYFVVYTRPEVTDYFDSTAPAQYLYLHSIRGISFVMPWSYLGLVDAIDEPDVPEFVFAGEGTDLVVGGAGTDFVFGESGTDWIQGHGGNDFIDGGEDADILQGDGPVTDLYFDEVYPGSPSEQGDDTIFGRGGNDLLNGGGGDDYLDGGEGDDILEGGDGNDYLIGGPGGDRLDGGAGDDVYAFAPGDGTDQITDFDGMNQIRFGASIVPLDVGLVLSTNGGLLLTYSATAQPQSTDALLGAMFETTTAQPDSIVINLRGESIDPASIPAKLPDFSLGFEGGARIGLQDLIIATPGVGTTIIGTEASDVLLDVAGDDLLQGGAGDDSIYGFTGNNRLEGGDGNDQIVAFLGSNAIDGGGGNDILIGGAGTDQIDGGEGDDTLFGAAGDDVLRGAEGNDVYFLRRGIGHDEVIDSSGSADLVQVGDGLLPQDIVVTRDSSHIYLNVVDSADRLAIQWYDAADSQIEQVRFDDWTTWSAATLEQFATQWALKTTGTDGDDSLWGSALPDSLAGLDGNDWVYGSGGDDVLDGGPGNDVLEGEDGADTLIGGSGNDLLAGDQWWSTPSIDTLIGGSGDDIYYADALDLVVEAPDEGYDRIETDTAGTLPDNVEALLLYGSQPIDVYGNALDNVIDGNDASNLIVAGNGNDTLRGNGGDDELQGGAGDDVLDGGVGADTLRGGAGDDDYYFARGAGQDLVIDDGSAVRGDRVVLTPDVTPADVGWARDGQDMVLSLVGTEDALRIRWFDSPDRRIESIEFADGTVWRLNSDGSIAPDGDGPYVANVIDIVTADEDVSLTWIVPETTFANAEGATYSATGVAGSALPSWLAFDPVTRTLAGTPGNDQVGDIEIQITATDELGRSATEPFILRVNNVNDAPTLVGQLPDVEATEDSTFALELPSVFSDVDAGDSLQISAARVDGSALPGWLDFDPNTRSFSGTPSNADVGAISVRVTATDLAGAQAFGDFSIAVANTNDAPVLVVPLENRSIPANATTEFSVPAGSFADQDVGDILTYSATLTDGTPLPQWLTLDAATGRFVATPIEADVGQTEVRISATDLAGTTVSDEFALSVSSQPGETFDGTIANEAIVGTSGADILDGKGGADFLGGGGGADVILGGAGLDVLDGDGFVWSAPYANQTLIVPPAEEGNDLLDGGSMNDVLRGGGGHDVLIGGEHNDSLYGQAGNDVLQGGPGVNLLVGGDEGVVSSNGNDTFVHGKNSFDTIEDLDLTPGNLDILRFDAGIDPSSITLRRDDTGLLIAFSTEEHRVFVRNYFADATSEIGGAGQIEEFQFATGEKWTFDSVMAILNSSENQARAAVLYGMDTAAYVYMALWTTEYDTYRDAGGYRTFRYSMPAGNTTDDTIVGGAPWDEIHGGGGRDLLIGGSGGNDFLWGEAGDDYLVASPLASALHGGDGDDVLIGGDGQDWLDGGSGNDYLAPGKGSEFSNGGLGADTYVYRRGDGNDRVEDYYATASELIVDDGSIDTLQLIDINPSEVAPVWSQANIPITLAQGHRFLIDGGASTLDFSLIERVEFGDGTVWTKQDLIARTPAASDFGEYRILSSSESPFHALGGDDMVIGTAGSDEIYGDGGNDHLRGGVGGNDRLYGGEGNDELYTGDTWSALSDVLDGGPGADYMGAGLGSDTYYVDDPGDYVSDNGGELDEVFASISLQIPYGVEKLTLVGGATDARGSAGSDILVGNGLPNQIEGFGGSDQLDGKGGADKMFGGEGDDTYFVDDAGDIVVEVSAESIIGGTDEIRASVPFVLPQNVENLTLTGIAGLDGSGNTLSNVITGNAGFNRLDGREGSDTLVGGVGDDTLVVDGAGDVVIELTGEGVDTVESSVTYTLASNVENLVLTGSAAINGVGNELNNSLIGNNAANTLSGGVGDDRLDGGTGADSMAGGIGNDTYVIDNASDSVTERNGEGSDTVESNISYALGSNVEHLMLSGTAPINGTGNSASNLVVGNSSANTLNGGSGLDVLQGGEGNDTLQDTSGKNLLDGGSGVDTIAGGKSAEFFAGSEGSDTFTLGGGADIVAFNRGDGADIVDAPAGKTSGAGEKNDTLSLGGIRISDVGLARESNDLLVKVAGTTDTIRMKDWYASANNQTLSTLQSIVDSTSDYDPTSPDPLVNKRVVRWNFATLVNAFNAAYATNPALGDWAIPVETLNAAILGSSDSQALGGDLAYRYAHDGSFSGLDFVTATAELEDASFGVTAQTFAIDPTMGGMRLSGNAVNEGVLRLASTAEGAVALDSGDSTLSEDVRTLRTAEPKLQYLAESFSDWVLSVKHLGRGTTSDFGYGAYERRSAVGWTAMETALTRHLEQHVMAAAGEELESESRRADWLGGLQWLADSGGPRNRRSFAQVI